jgi:transposase
VRAIEAMDADAFIPSRKSRMTPREIDGSRYKDRNLDERFWARVKQYRRVATRYEKQPGFFWRSYN